MERLDRTGTVLRGALAEYHHSGRSCFLWMDVRFMDTRQ